MTGPVAIVGAGMAGATAARKLRRNGAACVLFEKSRGLGGRMATRRADNLYFDHGAQYFTARGQRFGALACEWRSERLVKEWFDGAFVGTPTMNAPIKAMIGNDRVVTNCQVAGLDRSKAGWTILTRSGPVEMPENGQFSSVILAIPAPHVLPLVKSAGIDFPELKRVRYAPCWALMLAFSGPSGLRQDTARFDDCSIAWIARNASKPGRDIADETLVVHASPSWSRDHLEMTPSDVIPELHQAVLDAVGERQTPYHATAHRWRFALVEETAAVPCLWDGEVGLGACGDWALGPRVEAAFDSGEAVAAALLAQSGR